MQKPKVIMSHQTNKNKNFQKICVTYELDKIKQKLIQKTYLPIMNEIGNK